MFINPYNSSMQLIYVAVLFSFATLVVFAEETVSRPLDLNKAIEILNEKGAEKAIDYIYDEGRGEDGARYPTFSEYISSGNSDWFRVLTRISSEPLEFERQFAVGAIAEALAEHPVIVFEYWQEVLSKNKYLTVNCIAWDFVGTGNVYDPFGIESGVEPFLENPSYLTMPMYRAVLEKRRKAVMTIPDKKLQTVRNQCMEQIDSTLYSFKNKYEDKLGFISNEKGKYIYSNKAKKNWYNKAELPPLNWRNMFEQKKREDTYERRDPKMYYHSIYYAFENSIYDAFENETPWPSFMAKTESANKDWLVFLKEVYSLFYAVRRIDRDLALGQALTKDPQTVFTVLKEVLSEGDELKNVCGNTYEDLLWDVAVEEQVIGAAVEKLEARKKSLLSMKDKSLSDMKNQCIQAVDNSLAVWKGRAQ